MNICTIVGARPQFIKAATVSRNIETNSSLNEFIIHTGQHYDSNMSSQFFDELSIPKPKYNLNVGSASHGKQTGEMLDKIEDVLLQERPDIVLIYGDTNSTLAGALAAAKLHIPVAHIEAGLRSFNRKMPEEINRIMADHISTLLFAPTDSAFQQLQKEGITETQIFNVGDVMYDAVLFYNEYNSRRQTIVGKLSLSSNTYALSTIHRAENTDCAARMTNIVNALIDLSKIMKIVFPLHPRTRETLIRHNLLEAVKTNLTLLEPVGYLDMLALEKHAQLIITDSGGVQKEAYFNQVPCITLREETEWRELVEGGWNQLCSTSNPFSLTNFYERQPLQVDQKPKDLYGAGNAAQKIVKILTEYKRIH